MDARYPGTEPPLLQQDLIGSANGYYPGRIRDRIIGRHTNINNVRVDLWEGPTGIYVFPQAAQQMAVVSTSANDAAAGTGMQQVMIHYLDHLYAEKSETVTLNGVTPVLTVATDILRINGMHAMAFGTGGTSAGNISLTNAGGTVTYGFISAGYNVARQAIYTIPAGRTGYISMWQSSSGSTGNHVCQATLRATCHDGILVPGVFMAQDEMQSQNGGDTVPVLIPIPIPGTADVKISAISDAANAGVTCSGMVMGWHE